MKKKNSSQLWRISSWYAVSGSDTQYQHLIPSISIWYPVSGSDTQYKDQMYQDVMIKSTTFWRNIILHFVKNFNNGISGLSISEWNSSTFWRIIILHNCEEFPKETQLFGRIFKVKNFQSEEFSVIYYFNKWYSIFNKIFISN